MSKTLKQFATVLSENEREEIQKEITEKQRIEAERKKAFNARFNLETDNPLDRLKGENK